MVQGRARFAGGMTAVGNRLPERADALLKPTEDRVPLGRPGLDDEETSRRFSRAEDAPQSGERSGHVGDGTEDEGANDGVDAGARQTGVLGRIGTQRGLEVVAVELLPFPYPLNRPAHS